jgi:hypothetical protein
MHEGMTGGTPGVAGHSTAAAIMARVLPLILYAGAAALAVASLVSLAQGLASPSVTVTADLSETTTATTLTSAPELAERTDVTLTASGGGGLTVNATQDGSIDSAEESGAAPFSLRLLAALPTALWAAALAVIAFMLARFTASVMQADPFAPEQSRRLTVVAVATLVASVGADTLSYAAAAAFVDRYSLQAYLEPTLYYSFVPPTLAVVGFILAAAFRAGRRLADDTEGLV